MAVGDITRGRRVHNFEPFDYRPGDYGQWEGMWFCRTPRDTEHRRLQGNLTRHEVTEHADGTITVSPSILISSTWADETTAWHGYLERGVWREV